MGILLEKRTDKNATDSQGRTPLSVAVEENHAAAVTFLLDQKCDFELADEKGKTPVLKAAMAGNESDYL